EIQRSGNHPSVQGVQPLEFGLLQVGELKLEFPAVPGDIHRPGTRETLVDTSVSGGGVRHAEFWTDLPPEFAEGSEVPGLIHYRLALLLFDLLTIFARPSRSISTPHCDNAAAILSSTLAKPGSSIEALYWWLRVAAPALRHPSSIADVTAGVLIAAAVLCTEPLAIS